MSSDRLQRPLDANSQRISNVAPSAANDATATDNVTTPTAVGGAPNPGASFKAAAQDHAHDLIESGGAHLTFGSVANGQAVKRVGTALVGYWGAQTGATTVNFGAFPGGNYATVTVSGQTNITTGATIIAEVMYEASADNNAVEHLMAPIKFACGNIVAGTSFDIMASCPWTLTGAYAVRWIWF